MMMQTKKPAANPLMEIAERIREMREIVGYSEAEMAEKTEVSGLAAGFLVCIIIVGSSCVKLCKLLRAKKLASRIPKNL